MHEGVSQPAQPLILEGAPELRIHERYLLSRLIGLPLLDQDGDAVGYLSDLIARIEIEGHPQRYPHVTGLVVRPGGRGGPPPERLTGRQMRRPPPGGHAFFARWNVVARLDESGITLRSTRFDLRPFRRREGEVLLAKDVLDKQLVDLRGRRVVRANDVILAAGEPLLGSGAVTAPMSGPDAAAPTIVVLGVDVSTGALLARLLPAALARRIEPWLHRRLIPWDDIEVFTTDAPGVRLRLKHEKLRRLHPADLAALVQQLPRSGGAELLAALDEPLAADTVEALDAPAQAALLADMPPAQAADILEEMAPDEAADALAQLSPAEADKLLGEMEAPEAAEVQSLLTYQEGTAGAIMTTEYVALPRDLTAAQALERLRSMDWLPDLLYYIYVLDKEPDGRLVGVLTLRELIRAHPDVRIEEIMRPEPVTVTAETPAEEVARLIAHYDLVALPVVDAEGRLIGVVTVDDAMDVILPPEWKRRLPRLFS
jgi:magnesium transporter